MALPCHDVTINERSCTHHCARSSYLSVQLMVVARCSHHVALRSCNSLQHRFHERFMQIHCIVVAPHRYICMSFRFKCISGALFLFFVESSQQLAMAFKPALLATTGFSPLKTSYRSMTVAPLSTDTYMSALKLCTRQLCVGFATSCGEDVALLTDKIPAVCRHAVLSVCWNSDDPVGHQAFHEHFGQYFVDPAAKFNSAPV